MQIQDKISRFNMRWSHFDWKENGVEIGKMLLCKRMSSILFSGQNDQIEVSIQNSCLLSCKKVQPLLG